MIITIGFTVGVFVAPPDPAGVVGGSRAPVRRRELGAARRIDPRRDDHAARHLRALGTEPRPVRTHPCPQAGGDHGAGTVRHPARAGSTGAGRGTATAAGRLLVATRWDVSIAMVDRRHREPLHPAARCREPLGRRGHRQPRGRVRRPRQTSLGPIIATLFAVGLLASGLASTSVGAYAGAEIMHGLLHVRVPLIAPAARHAHPGAGDPRPRLRPHRLARAQPGRALVRHPVRAHPARVDHREAQRARPVRGTTGATTAAGIAASVFLITLNGVLLWLVFTGA